MRAALWRGKSLLAGLHGLIGGPSWDREELLRYQRRRLKSLVAYACRYVPFYTKLYQTHGIKPGDIQTLEDIQRLPVTSREDLQHFQDQDLWSQGIRKGAVVERTTSGSTGEPLRVRKTRAEKRLLALFRFRSLLQYGLRPFQRMASVHFLPECWRPFRRFRFPLQWIFPSLEMHCHLESQEIVSLLLKTKPQVLGGLPDILHRLSEAMDERDLEKVRPRFLVTGADILNPKARLDLIQRFKAPVFDRYSAVEFSLIAFSCPREPGHYHFCEDSVLVEVLKDGKPAGPGEVGEVLITSLHSYSMPFIRYKLGDLVQRDRVRCSSGMPYGVLKAIRGRIIDSFVKPGGSEFHVSIIDQSLRELAPWVRRYAVVQKRSGRIVIEATSDKDPGRAALLKTSQRISERIEGIPVSLVLRDKLPPAESGKFRLYRSERPARLPFPHSVPRRKRQGRQNRKRIQG